MTTAFSRIPIVDLKNENEEELAKEIARCCEEVGFFYLKNSAVCSQSVFEASHRFFALSTDEKMSMHIKKSPKTHRGYFPCMEESTNPTMPDYKEGFDMALELSEDDPDVAIGKPLHGPNVWPSEDMLPGFRRELEDYYKKMLALAKRLMRLFAIGLDLPNDWFNDKIDKPLAQLRLLHYPPKECPSLGCGAHTDYGCLTILAQDQIGGLQILNTKGEWIHAPPIPEYFIVNIGDQMARWTNDRFAATRHRVMLTNTAASQHRFSIPFFFDPNFDALIEVLPSCVPPGEEPKYKPLTAGAYLQSRFDETFKYRNSSSPKNNQ